MRNKNSYLTRAGRNLPALVGEGGKHGTGKHTADSRQGA